MLARNFLYNWLNLNELFHAATIPPPSPLPIDINPIMSQTSPSPTHAGIHAVRPNTVIKLSGITIAAMSIGISVFSVVWADRKMTDDAMDSMRRSTTILANQTYLAFYTVDTSLKRTARIVSDTAHTPAGFHENLVHIVLRDAVAELPTLQAYIVVNDDADIVAHSRLSPPPNINVSDRDYYIYHSRLLASHDQESFIGHAVANKVNGNWMITVSRRLDFAGKFAGVVMAGLDVSYFAWIYSDMYVPKGGALYTNNTDGSTLVSFPPGPIPSGPQYLSFTDTVPTYHLTVGMVIPFETLREPWRIMLLVIVGGSALTSVMVLALVTYTSMSVGKYEHWEYLREHARWTPRVIPGGKDAPL